MKTLFILVSILFFAEIWYCCSDPARQNKQHNTPSKPPDKVELLNLNIGEEYIVKLPDRSTAGYSWFFEVNRDWIISIKELDADLEPSQGQRNQDSSLAPPGALRVVRFAVKGIKAGEALLRFYQIRPWETQQKPVMEKYFKVLVASG